MNTPFYPEAKSPKYLAVRYIPSPVNKQDLHDAQALFKRAVKLGVCQQSERLVNQANYLLTGAYMGGEENNAYWSQF